MISKSEHSIVRAPKDDVNNAASVRVKRAAPVRLRRPPDGVDKGSRSALMQQVLTGWRFPPPSLVQNRGRPNRVPIRIPRWPMILYCVRHGESAYNTEGRIQGQSDVPLSELGRKQSEAVAEALARLPIEALYASPLRRAMQTAEPIARRLNLEIQTDPRLKEIHAGVFQDKVWTEIAEKHPDHASRWKSGDPDFAIPGGESRRDLMHRGKEVFEAIRASGRARVVVVSHGGLLAAALKALLEIPARLHPFSFPNGSISQLTFADDGRVELPVLNRVDHLADAGNSGSGDL